MSKKRRQPPPAGTPRWRPLIALPVIASTVEGHLSDVEEGLDTLRKARTLPCSLDNATVQRAVRIHRETLEAVALYERQVAHWRQETLSDPQRQELEHLDVQVQRLRAACQEILLLVGGLARDTVETDTGMTDEEAGMAYLAGRFAPLDPGRVSEDRRPAIVDVTREVFARTRDRLAPQEQLQLGTASEPYDDTTMLLYLSAMMPGAVEEAIVRSADNQERGMILIDQTGPKWAFRWVPQALCAAALHMATPDSRSELTDILLVYDLEVQGVIVMVTQTLMRAMLVDLDGTFRSPGSRPVQHAPFHMPEDVTSTSGMEPDGTAWYALRHRTMGTLGRLVLRQKGANEVEILTEVAEHPGASMDESLDRAAIFLSLASQLTERLRQGLG